MVLILEIVVVAVVIFAVAAFISGALPGMRPAPRDTTDSGLPPGRLRGADVDRARFGLAFRGYRMEEVDALLDRLRDELGRYEHGDVPREVPARDTTSDSAVSAGGAAPPSSAPTAELPAGGHAAGHLAAPVDVTPEPGRNRD